MVWWLLALLAGGAVLLSKEDDNNMLMLADLNKGIFKLTGLTDEQVSVIKNRMTEKGYAWREGYEKFRDPRIPRCFYSEGNPYAVKGDYTGWFVNGLAENYLNWPVVGDALLYIGETLPFPTPRIAKLKERVNYYRNEQSKSLEGITQVSDNSLEKAITTLYSQIQDKKNWSALADRAGIPVSSIIEGEKNLEQSINNWTRTNLHLDVMSVFNGLKDDISKLLNSAVKSVSKEFAAQVNSAGSTFSGVAPILSQFVDVVIKAKDACETNKRDNTIRFFQAMGKPLTVMVDKGLPFPWHIHENWPGINNVSNTCGYFEGGKWLPSLDMQGAYQDYLYACVMMTQFSIAEKAYLTRWWADAQVLMADPMVYSIFNAMGRNRGLFASDEQVLAVATPIAVMNGLDPYAFAELLWGFDEGWANPSIKYTSWEVDEILPETCEDVPGGSACSYPSMLFKLYNYPGSKERLVVNVTPCYANTPMNAWALNFASLTKTAYELADILKDEGIGLNIKKKIEIKGDLTSLGLTSL